MREVYPRLRKGVHLGVHIAGVHDVDAEIGMLGGDVMEVAPPLRDKPDSTERTVALAVRYLRETLAAVLHTDIPGSS